MNLPTIKVYAIDYDFLIKNYLNPKLWSNTWTIFTYGDYTFTLTMSSIDVKTNSIWFEIQLKGLEPYIWYKISRTFKYNIANSNIEMLKNSLKGEMIRLVSNYEEKIIEHTDDYIYIENNYDEECEKLRQIAERFLDENQVYNDTIREAYIDRYVEDNETLYEQKNNFIQANKYLHLTKLYLILAEVWKYDSLKEKVVERLNCDTVSLLMNEIIEIVKDMQTEEWLEDKQNNLEGV